MRTFLSLRESWYALLLLATGAGWVLLGQHFLYEQREALAEAERMGTRLWCETCGLLTLLLWFLAIPTLIGGIAYLAHAVRRVRTPARPPDSAAAFGCLLLPAVLTIIGIAYRWLAE